MAGVTPDLRLPSRPQNTATAPWSVLIPRPSEEKEAELASVVGCVLRRHTRERSPISLLTALDVEQLR